MCEEIQVIYKGTHHSKKNDLNSCHSIQHRLLPSQFHNKTYAFNFNLCSSPKYLAQTDQTPPKISIVFSVEYE